MRWSEVGRIPLPSHAPGGGFDHAAIDPRTDRRYVAHPSNDALEVVDLVGRRHLRTLPGRRGIAGDWVDPDARRLFRSDRGERTASVMTLAQDGEAEAFRVATGSWPNGLASDPTRGHLLVAGVGDRTAPGSPPTLTVVDVRQRSVLGQLDVPGKTRWALYYAPTEAFYVNVAEPSVVLSVGAGDPVAIARRFTIPAAGPHGLEQDPGGRRLYCACDDGALMALDLSWGAVHRCGTLAGPPDVPG